MSHILTIREPNKYPINMYTTFDDFEFYFLDSEIDVDLSNGDINCIGCVCDKCSLNTHNSTTSCFDVLLQIAPELKTNYPELFI